MFDVRFGNQNIEHSTSNTQHRSAEKIEQRKEAPMFGLFHIREHQRGLWFRKGDFQDVLQPGTTWLLNLHDSVEIIDTLATRFDHKLLDVLANKPALRAELEIVELGA